MIKGTVKKLLPEKEIQKRIASLAKQINKDYKGKEIIFVGILKGSVIFLADLIRKIDIPIQTEYFGVKSYIGTESSGKPIITHDLGHNIKDKHVIVVEDIIDTGTTLDFLLNYMRGMEPASLKICSLLLKPDCFKKNYKVDYVGFEIPNKFVVGYGLDVDEQYRNLPYIGVFNQKG